MERGLAGAMIVPINDHVTSLRRLVLLTSILAFFTACVKREKEVNKNEASDDVIVPKVWATNMRPGVSDETERFKRVKTEEDAFQFFDVLSVGMKKEDIDVFGWGWDMGSGHTFFYGPMPSIGFNESPSQLAMVVVYFDKDDRLHSAIFTPNASSDRVQTAIGDYGKL